MQKIKCSFPAIVDMKDSYLEEYMIFISYNHKDEQLVDMIARRLELEFGRDNIF